MLSLSCSARYFLYDQPTDMRCGVYSLAGLVTNKLGRDPLSGEVFIFMGKSANQIRLLQWDADGFALYIKRLESGTFERPAAGQVQLAAGELMLILQGIRLASVKHRKRFSRLAK
jgi:transposase